MVFYNFIPFAPARNQLRGQKPNLILCKNSFKLPICTFRKDGLMKVNFRSPFVKAPTRDFGGVTCP